MGKISREPAAAARENYDLIIIGGGIYGAMFSLEASRRGLSSLLLERNDFGGATSFNTLRILHGGFRYLQTMDLKRFRESVGERRWFIQNFTDLVKPLPCLMPLYGNGLRRPSVFRVVLWSNDLLSFRRNQDVNPDGHLPGGRIISPKATREIFSAVDPEGLQGGAVWYDACMRNSQRVVIETLRWACERGAKVLNYVEAKELLKTSQGVAGVMASDRETGECYEYRASVVVNAAGPWCGELANRFDRDEPDLFRSSLAWNVLLNRNPLSEYALAVAPKKPKGRTYFLLPWKGMLLAGTGHAVWNGSPEEPMPAVEQLQEFLQDLNFAVPGLKVNERDIIHVFAGLLPVRKAGLVDLASREVIINHAVHGGPQGLYSISGVKFTTSRLVAEKTLKEIFADDKVTTNTCRESFKKSEDGATRLRGVGHSWYPLKNKSKWQEALRSLILEESVLHLDDLIFRRTNLWEYPEYIYENVLSICQVFQWDDSRCDQEIERLRMKMLFHNNFLEKNIMTKQCDFN